MLWAQWPTAGWTCWRRRWVDLCNPTAHLVVRYAQQPHWPHRIDMSLSCLLIIGHVCSWLLSRAKCVVCAHTRCTHLFFIGH